MKTLSRSFQQALLEYTRASFLTACIVHLGFPLWLYIVKLWPFSDVWLFVVTSVIVHESMYLGFFILGLVLESQQWMQQYRIPRRPAQVPSATLVKGTLREAFVSHMIFQPLTLYLLHPYLVISTKSNDEPLPSFFYTFCSLFFFMFLNDSLFAIIHYTFHANQWLYEHVHKKHHQYSGSIGIAAEYANPFEAFVGNQFPVIAAVLLLKAHPWTWLVYLFWRLWRTYEGHCGYSFVNSFLSKFGLMHGYAALYHDFHHSSNRGNFSGPAHGMWDHIIGLVTGKDFQVAWRKHCSETTFHKEAHRTYWLS